MRRILCIARREYLASVRTKGFVIGLILAPVLMLGGLIGVVLLRGQVDVSDKRIAVLDQSGFLADTLLQAAEERNGREVQHPKTGKKIMPAYLLEIVPPTPGALLKQRLDLSERVRDGRLHAFVEIGPEILHPGTNRELAQVNYHAKGAVLDDIRRWLETPLNQELRRRLAEAGLEEARIKGVFEWVPVRGMGLVTADPRTGQPVAARQSNEMEAIGVPLTAMILMWIITPTLMLLRQSLPVGVPAWQPWLGLAGMLIFTVLLVFAASRVFRIGLLLQGKRPKLTEIMRWALRG